MEQQGRWFAVPPCHYTQRLWQTSYNAGLRLYLNSLEKQSVQKLPGEVGRLHLAGFTAPPAPWRGSGFVFYPFIVIISALLSQCSVCVMCLLSLKRGWLSRTFVNIFKFSFVKRYIFNLVKRFYYQFSRKTLLKQIFCLSASCGQIFCLSVKREVSNERGRKESVERQ